MERKSQKKQRNRDQDKHFDTNVVYVVQILRDPEGWENNNCIIN